MMESERFELVLNAIFYWESMEFFQKKKHRPRYNIDNVCTAGQYSTKINDCVLYHMHVIYHRHMHVTHPGH